MARFYWVMLSLLLANSAAASVEPLFGRESYRDVQATLRQLESSYPLNAEVVAIGQADGGQMIEALKIGSGAVKHLVVATHHGNEYGSTEVAKSFAASLAESPVAGQTIYVIPVLNTAGFDSRSRREPAGGRTYDPNRDYPNPCGSEGPFRLKSTAALARFVEQEGIVAVATLHTYSPAVVYPWGMGRGNLSTHYDPIFEQLAVAATVESRYEVGNSAEVIYPANGTFEDYVYWKHGVWSLLFEVGRSHSPGDKEVADMIRVNVPGLRRMFEQAPRERAERHEFEGQCDFRLLSLDRHDE
ncbi:MAG: hypothetical protein A2X94_02965 [Bdellovibrionales bacterium GWB1_55_8]|nr:MAG: hypothetical protein A2X94_02965 [Bdellovibrionales bacterium GWB1_55_8]